MSANRSDRACGREKPVAAVANALISSNQSSSTAGGGDTTLGEEEFIGRARLDTDLIRDANTTSVPTIVGPTQLFDIVGQTVGSANCKTRGCEVSHGQRAPHNVARAATRERANILHIIKCPKEDEHREREYQPSGSPQRGLDEPVRIRAGSGATIRGSTRITAYPATDPAPKPGAKIRMGR